ncbi:hypothetical protein M2302_002895 [Micromonospora sp. A200]|uniref:hypothetical protein n=1 Tax=Micromonospora sp. A200 TaxID=2940568 RepID=UPI0024751EDB|nr:hypothetical protein [Micromonospora sp. A200]MDH6462715.1 hypothetical protein [Micromonospora sp. A200]
MNGRPTGPLIGSLCTGYGGLDLAVELVLGGRLAWYAETDRHARVPAGLRRPATNCAGACAGGRGRRRIRG